MKRNKDIETIIQLSFKALKAEGYELKRYKNSKTVSTDAYESLAVKSPDGKYFTITFDQEEDRFNPNTGKTIPADYIFKNI